MANINEMLKEQIKSSRQFPDQNFGLKIGKGWPEFVQQVLATNELRQELYLSFMLGMLQADKVLNRAEHARQHDPAFLDKMAAEPGVYETPLKFLYWGIQIGRQMAEVQRLEEMAGIPRD